jgi:restriction system protein
MNTELSPIASLLVTFLTNYWWMIAITLLVRYLRSPSGKGRIGEILVTLSAKLVLDGGIYHLLSNVTFQLESGTTQIDHILVSKFGVFVIETKNYSGQIRGDQHQTMWSQKFKRTSHLFQNPLLQNYKHTRAVEHILAIAPGEIFPLVVFVGNNRFLSAMPDNVTTLSGYLRYIQSKDVVLFSPDQVNAMVTRLDTQRLGSCVQVDRQHIAYVNICPRIPLPSLPVCEANI